jgi:hypothetical protein
MDVGLMLLVNNENGHRHSWLSSRSQICRQPSTFKVIIIRVLYSSLGLGYYRRLLYVCI